MRTPRTPSLRRHKPSSLGVVTLNGKDHYLGHWPEGSKNPPEAVRLAYDQLIAEWLAAGRRLTAKKRARAELPQHSDGHRVGTSAGGPEPGRAAPARSPEGWFGSSVNRGFHRRGPVSAGQRAGSRSRRRAASRSTAP
jgi:hypothetical protein